MTYRTVSGDMWDSIALKTMGSEMFKDRLMNANKQYRTVYIFTAGIELIIPTVGIEDTAVRTAGKPPWRG